jgi:hypothetical protein
MDEFERELLRRLRELPVPPPSPGFAARVLHTAAAPAWRPALGMALAATLVIAVAGGVWLAERGAAPVTPTEPRLVLLAAGEVQPVSLVFRSPRALSGVTIHVQLPDGVELAGHPARTELSWQADLQVGANRLDLPVVVRRGDGGVVTTSLSYGQDRRHITVLVRAREPSAPNGGGSAAADRLTSV